MNHELLAMLAGVLTAGCAVTDLEHEESSPPATEAGVECSVPPEYELLATGSIVQDDIIVGKLADLQAACAAGRPWSPRRGGLRNVGKSHPFDLWPDRRVPYEIDDDLPQRERVEEAIEHWEDVTSIDFVLKRSDDDAYVYFTNGDACSSRPGRTGDRQDVELSTGKDAADIVGSSIAPSGDVYTWYADGMVSAGSSRDLDSVRAQYPYSLPSGYTAADIVGIAIAKSTSHVYVWYANGRVSSGTSSDLDEYRAPAPFTLPPGKTIADIVEIDIARDDDVYTWFDDRTVSIGTSTDLDAHRAPAPFTTPSNLLTSQIRGVGIAANDDDVYTWYSDGTVSIGTSSDLDRHEAPYAFTTPVPCNTSSAIHEIGHAVGLLHEQSHPDRDQHVRVFWANIQPGKVDNFEIATGSLIYTDYDVTSRMHYRSDSFSVNGSPTLLRKAIPGSWVSSGLVIDMSISDSSDVYTWWSDGTVTSGASDDLELHRSRYAFTLPSGYVASDIIGIAIAKDTGNTYAFYRDSTRSVGTTANLASISDPVPFTLPPGYTAGDITAIDIAPNGRTYAWYDDGRVSSGTSTDLDAYTAPTPFTLAPDRTASHVLGIGIAPSGSAYVWYTNGEVSAGSSTDLDADRTAYVFASRGLLLSPSSWLTAGDINQVELMYDLW